MRGHGRQATGPDRPVDGGATPWWLDDLLRSAAAAVIGEPPERVPAAEPRRAPTGTGGDYASALALRLAGVLRLPADALAADIATELRSSPHVVSAAAEGRGFVNVTLRPRARLSLVRAARESGYLVGRRHDCDHPGADRDGRTAAPWTLTPLDRAETLAGARDCARVDARRRIGLVAGPHAVPGVDAPAEEVTWRDHYLDSPPGPGAPARLLAVVGEASARFAFCRSVPERPRAGELTGPGLPAVPTAEEPGKWRHHTAENPGFAVRYAHAHAVRTGRWATDAGIVVPTDVREAGALTDEAVVALDERHAAALVGCLFDGPGVLSAAAGRRQPHFLVRYLEGVATAYHDWRESCTVVPVAAPTAQGEAIRARLELCAAVAGVLRTGLSLLGISAPTRL